MCVCVMCLVIPKLRAQDIKLLPFKSSKNRTIFKVFFVSLYSCKFNKDDLDFMNCSMSPFLIPASD